jgi:membrane-associated phospholipid phosphatase
MLSARRGTSKPNEDGFEDQGDSGARAVLTPVLVLHHRHPRTTPMRRWLSTTARVCLAVVCLGGGVPPALAGQQSTGAPGGADHIVEPAQPPSLGSLFQEVPGDLWRFVSLDTAIVLTVGGGAAALAHVWDDDVVAELQVNPALNDAFEPGTKYGAFAIMLGGSFAVYGAGLASGHRHMAVVGADLVRGQIVSQAWVQGIKFTVRRERPDGSNQQSFPSGHAASGFAAAAVLARHYGWKAAVPAYLGATYIAAARVHDNRHYVSDVTFGAAMGIAAARTVMLKAGRYHLRVVPALGSGGAALMVSVVPRP